MRQLFTSVLQALQEELRSRQRQVSSLQDISSHLLLEATEEESIEAKEKVHVIGNKLCLLLRQAAAQLHRLQGRTVGHRVVSVQESGERRPQDQLLLLNETYETNEIN